MGASKRLFAQLREELANEVIAIEGGFSLGALDLYHEVNQFSKDLSQFKTDIESHAKNEISMGTELTGYDVKVKNGAVRFDFKCIQAWQEKNKELKEIESQSKQAYLSTQKGMAVASEDGEEIELPKVSYTKDSISITKVK